jgi:drug/metabolite transporter (DMT)-like permease
MPLSPTLKAAVWMSGALFSFVALALAGRELGSGMGVAQIQVFRSAVGVVVVGAVAWRAGWRTVSPRSFGVHLVRNVVHFAGQLGWFYGLTVIPFAQVFSIEFTAPIWTAIFAVLILGERMTRPRLLAIALGLAGVLVILRPGLGIVSPAALAVLGGAVCFGLSHTLVKRLTRDNTALGILFSMTVLQLPMGFVLALPDWTWPATPVAWMWTLTVGLTALSAHFCIAKAMAHADATVVVPMDFLRLPLVTAVGLLAYGETVDLWLLAGAGLILAGILQNLHAERRR